MDSVLIDFCRSQKGLVDLSADIGVVYQFKMSVIQINKQKQIHLISMPGVGRTDCAFLMAVLSTKCGHHFMIKNVFLL